VVNGYPASYVATKVGMTRAKDVLSDFEGERPAGRPYTFFAYFAFSAANFRF